MSSPSTWSASITHPMYSRVANSNKLQTSSSNKTSTNIRANSRTNLRRCPGTPNQATVSTAARTMIWLTALPMDTSHQCSHFHRTTTCLINKNRNSQESHKCTITATIQTTWTTVNSASIMSTIVPMRVNSNINHMNHQTSTIIFIKGIAMVIPTIMVVRAMPNTLKVIMDSNPSRVSRYRPSHPSSIGSQTSSCIELLLSSMIALPSKSNGRVTRTPRSAKANCLVVRRSSTTMATTSSGAARI